MTTLKRQLRHRIMLARRYIHNRLCDHRAYHRVAQFVVTVRLNMLVRSKREYIITFVQDIGGIEYTRNHSSRDIFGIAATCRDPEGEGFVRISWKPAEEVAA